MISVHTTAKAGRPPRRPAGMRLVASVDVEWTKNYRIANGNVPFCYSVTYLLVPATGRVDLSDVPVLVSSRYVEEIEETAGLVQAASAEIDRALQTADLVVGHQLSSDLAVLQAAGTLRGTPVTCAAELQRARMAWHQRRAQHPAPGQRARVIDTRYDADHVLTGTSRRLVDVCTDLALDVTQPELRGTSMTAVHRRWLDHGDVEARERVTVLNLRHSLSAALVALSSTGRMQAGQPVQVNEMLVQHLPDHLDWLRHPQFMATLAVA